MLAPIEELDLIKLRLYSKEINYKQAKFLAKPYVDIINNKAKEIAKKYNMKPKLVSFSGIMR
jgi:hypothetical protein